MKENKNSNHLELTESQLDFIKNLAQGKSPRLQKGRGQTTITWRSIPELSVLHSNMNGHHEKWARNQNHRFAKHENRFSTAKKELVRLRCLRKSLKLAFRKLTQSAPHVMCVDPLLDSSRRHFFSVMYSQSLHIRHLGCPIIISGSAV